MPRIIEKVTKYQLVYGTGMLRVWRQLPEETADFTPLTVEQCFGEDADVRKVCDEFYSPGKTVFWLAEAVAKLGRVNAVEYTDRWGQGFCIFPDWP